jgi:hypothetical protein
MVVMIKDMIEMRKQVSDENIELIKRFYDKLDRGSLIDARAMYTDPGHIFKMVEDWSDADMVKNLYGFQKLNDNNYRYRLFLRSFEETEGYKGYETLVDYEIEVRIEAGKIVPVYAERVVEEVYSSEGVKYISLHSPSRSRFVSRKGKVEKEIVGEKGVDGDVFLPTQYDKIMSLKNDNYLVYENHFWESFSLSLLNVKTGEIKEFPGFSAKVTDDERYLMMYPSDVIKYSDNGAIYDISAGKTIYELPHNVFSCKYDKEANAAVFDIHYYGGEGESEIRYHFDTGKVEGEYKDFNQGV